MLNSNNRKELEWMINKLETRTSVIYPDGNPVKLIEYKDRLKQMDEYDSWVMGAKQRHQQQAAISLLRMTGFNSVIAIPTEFDYEQLKKEYCCGACGTVFIGSDTYCIQCGVKL